MSRQSIYNMLVKAKLPFDVFGEVENLVDLKKVYLGIAKQIHPDTALDKDKYISNQGFIMLQHYYEWAQEQMNDGLYAPVIIPSDSYRLGKQKSLFEIILKDGSVSGEKCTFYECIYNGEVSDIYRGLRGDDTLVCLKLGIDEGDNDLLKAEYDTLNTYNHVSLPIVRKFLKVNNCSAILMDAIEGENLEDIMKRNKLGLSPEVVMWIMERLFSVVGYLHSNYIVHGNILPENIIINKNNHNAILTGFSFHIPNANEKDKHYQIRNDDYSAPEVDKTVEVLPQSDIYSLGKLAIYMLGGNIHNNGMPINIDSRIRTFIRELVVEDKAKRPNDAWQLWDKWREIRTLVYGKDRFKDIDF